MGESPITERTLGIHRIVEPQIAIEIYVGHITVHSFAGYLNLSSSCGGSSWAAEGGCVALIAHTCVPVVG